MVLRTIKFVRGKREPAKGGQAEHERVFGFTRYAYKTERTFCFVWGVHAFGIQWIA